MLLLLLLLLNRLRMRLMLAPGRLLLLRLGRAHRHGHLKGGDLGRRQAFTLQFRLLLRSIPALRGEVAEKGGGREEGEGTRACTLTVP